MQQGYACMLYEKEISFHCFIFDQRNEQEWNRECNDGKTLIITLII